MKLTAIVEIYNSLEMIQHLVISALLMRHSSDSRLVNTQNTDTLVDMRVTRQPVDAKKNHIPHQLGQVNKHPLGSNFCGA